MTQQPNSDGRKENEAEPLGDFTALGGEDKIARTGVETRKRAGPAGPDAAEVGDTFKKDPAAGKR